MILIVESNFVLELAFRQEEYEQANRLLELAEARTIQLAIPAYALVEPLEKLHRNRAARRTFAQDLERELAQMSRSLDFADIREKSNATMAALAKKSDIDEADYGEAVGRIARCAQVIELSREVVVEARARQLFDLKAHDAIIFSSVEGFLKANTGSRSVFANKNSKDFLVETVVASLDVLNCEVVTRFGAALGKITAHLGKQV